MIIREHKGQSLVELLDDYIVLDLETTGLDPNYDEIIEIAAARVTGGKIFDSYNTLVKSCNKVNEFITKLTGITNDMLIDAPSLEEVLPAFYEYVGQSIVVGHNVNFDINFLYDEFLRHSGNHFTNNFVDTMRLSRRLFKDFVNHKLTSIVENFGVTVIPTHRALTDCQATHACYEYIKRFVSDNNIDIQDLFARKTNPCKAANIAATVEEFDENHPLYGKVCVFTGALSFTRKEAMQLVANVGGINADNVNKQTNYLIIGNNDYCTQIKDGKSNKQKKAEALILAGHDITILSETTFLDLLKDSQVKEDLPIPENKMPAPHYAYACAVSSALAAAGVNTEWLRFVASGERLDVLCEWLAFRIMICKKSTYIIGFTKLQEFKNKYPTANIIELSKEYRIVLTSPDEIQNYSEALAYKFNSSIQTVLDDLKYHASGEYHLKSYLNSKEFIKI